jgi:tripartite-type tricarboxylate transporter receptor subunit TctC
MVAHPFILSNLEDDMPLESYTPKKCSAMNRRVSLNALLLSACAFGVQGGVQAQEWPSNPIKLIIPFAPGGGNDGAGRLLAKALEDRLKVPVVVDNKAGANGTIAMNFLRQSKPDGYTVSLVSTGALDVNPWMMNLPYDPAKDFTYLGTIVKFPLYLAVLPSSGIKSVADLLAKARAEPGKVTYSSAGIGNSIHLAGALLAHMTNTQMTHVPYKGAGPAANALLGGEVTFTFGSGPSISSFADAGRVVLLGVSDSTRVTARGRIPTVEEAGVKGFESVSLAGVVAPAGLPADITHKLSVTIKEVIDSPEMQQKIYALGMLPISSSAKEYESMVAKDREKYGALIKAANIRAE